MLFYKLRWHHVGKAHQHPTVGSPQCELDPCRQIYCVYNSSDLVHRAQLRVNLHSCKSSELHVCSVWCGLYCTTYISFLRFGSSNCILWGLHDVKHLVAEFQERNVCRGTEFMVFQTCKFTPAQQHVRHLTPDYSPTYILCTYFSLDCPSWYQNIRPRAHFDALLGPSCYTTQ